MKLFCYGDSLVNGYPFPRNNSFPSILAKKTGADIQNHGMNGITAGDVFRVLEGDLADGTDAVLISCGSNDFMLGSMSPRQVTYTVSKMTDISSARGVKKIFICAPPLTDPAQAAIMWMPGISYEQVNRHLEEYRQLLERSFDGPASEKMHFIDIQTDYKKYAKYIDGVHPTAEGYELIAEIISGKLLTASFI